MASRIMSDTEIRHRKKIQSVASRTTGTLGLASLGLYGASKLPGAKVMTKTPKLRRIASRIPSEKLKDASLGTSTTAGAIGGAASFNFASYTNAEARKKKPVSKSDQTDPFNIEKMTKKEKKGLIGGAVGGAFGPVGGAVAGNLLAPHGKKGRYTAAGALGGAFGPVGGAVAGYNAATAKKPKKVAKSAGISAFGVEHD